MVRGRVQTYKEPQQKRAEGDFLKLAMGHRPAEPLAGPLLLGVQAFFPVSKSWSGKKQKAAIDAGWMADTPDFDNILKHVKDCLTMAGFWVDDRQVVGHASRFGKVLRRGAPLRGGYRSCAAGTPHAPEPPFPTNSIANPGSPAISRP